MLSQSPGEHRADLAGPGGVEVAITCDGLSERDFAAVVGSVGRRRLDGELAPEERRAAGRVVLAMVGSASPTATASHGSWTYHHLYMNYQGTSEVAGLMASVHWWSCC